MPSVTSCWAETAEAAVRGSTPDCGPHCEIRLNERGIPEAYCCKCKKCHGKPLRRLAYMRNTTVSAIIAGYIDRCIKQEDFSRYQPPDDR